MAKKQSEKMEIMGVERASITRIDDIIQQYQLPALVKIQNLERDLMVAEGLSALEQAITDPMVQAIKKLEGSPLGYLTDKDQPKDGKPQIPYPISTIKKCWIAASLMGLRMAGNEVNIFGGRVYATKAGLQRLVKTFPGMSDLNPQIMLKSMDESRAVVNFVATWKLNGQPERLEGEIPIRVNARMEVDAVLGKAKRKCLARIYEFLVGSEHIPDGEIGDDLGAPAPASHGPALSTAQGKTSFKRPAPQKTIDVTPEASPEEPEPSPDPQEEPPQEPDGPPQPPAELAPLLVKFQRGPFLGKTFWDCVQTPEGLQYLEFIKEKKPDQVELIDKVIASWKELSVA